MAGRLAVVGVFAIAIALAPAIGLSCMCDYYDQGFLLEEGAVVPANATGVLWAGPLVAKGGVVELPPISNFEFSVAAGAAWVPVRFSLIQPRHVYLPESEFASTVLVLPNGGFVAGGKYRVRYTARETRPLRPRGEWPNVEFQVIHFAVSENPYIESPVKDPRDMLIVSDPVDGLVRVASSGSCSLEVPANYVDIRIAEELVPSEWRGSFLFSTVVTERQYYQPYRPWHPESGLCRPVPSGRSWVGVGEDRLFTVCDDVVTSWVLDYSLVPGAYFVRLYAWLPGTDVVFSAPGFFEVGCTE